MNEPFARATQSRSRPTGQLASAPGWAFGVARDADGVLRISAPSRDAPGVVDLRRGGLRVLGYFLPAPSEAAFETARGDASALALALHDGALDCAGVVIDEGDATIIALRSASAVAPLSVHAAGGLVAVSNLDRMTAALAGGVAFDVAGALSFLLSFYPLEPQTLYAGVKRLPRGEVRRFAWSGVSVLRKGVDVGEIEEAPGERSALVGNYREAVCAAMRGRIVGRPGLLLSGGLDSVALGVHLTRDLGYRDAPAITFRVKGAHRDETLIAAEAAAFLGLRHDVVEIDSSCPADLDRFVTQTNAPDISAVFSGIIADAVRSAHGGVTTLFSGQDSRLHTPWLSKPEIVALQHPRLVDVLIRGLAPAAGLAPDAFAASANPTKRLIHLVGAAGDLRRLFAMKAFKCHFMPDLFRRDALDAHLSARVDDVSRVLGDGASLRRRFNALVELTLFRAQTPFDGAAWREPMLSRGLSVALPYQDAALVRLCAGLPWSETSGTMKGVAPYDLGRRKAVNKAFLRRALAQDLPPRLLLRDKAVAPSADVVMSGMFAPHMRRMAEEPGGVLDGPLGEFLDREGVRRAVRRAEGGWRFDERRVAAVIGLMTLLDCLARAR